MWHPYLPSRGRTWQPCWKSGWFGSSISRSESRWEVSHGLPIIHTQMHPPSNSVLMLGPLRRAVNWSGDTSFHMFPDTVQYVSMSFLVKISFVICISLSVCWHANICRSRSLRPKPNPRSYVQSLDTRIGDQNWRPTSVG